MGNMSKELEMMKRPNESRLKNIIVIKKINRFNVWIETTEERISTLENRSIEVVQTEEQRKKNVESK